MNVERQVRSILASILDIEPERIEPGARFREDLGADSLDLVELIGVLSRTFKADVRDEEVGQITTFGQAVAYLDRKIRANGLEPGHRPARTYANGSANGLSQPVPVAMSPGTD